MRSLKRRLCFSIIVLVLFGVIQTHAQCTPLKGTENLWTLPSLHWLLIGELHGSNEAPEAVIDIVCDALAHGRQITVALERPTREQTALEGMLLEPDVEKARQRLLKEPGWRVDPDSANIPDGRTSQAMLCLLIALRELHKRDATLSVAAFDAPFTGSDPGARDAVLGSTLLALGNAEPTKLIVVLTGNLHVMQSPVHGYDLAAMKLPAAQRLSLKSPIRAVTHGRRTAMDAGFTAEELAITEWPISVGFFSIPG